MKLSMVHMAIGLVAVVTLSYYFNREGFSAPPPPVAPFELADSYSLEPFSSRYVHSVSSDPVPSVSNPTVTVSDTAYDSMTLKQRSDLLKNVQKLVRDELLLSRQLNTLKEEEEEEEEEEEDPSEWQGRDYHRRCHQDGQEQEQGQGQGQDQGQEQKRKHHYRCPKNPDGSCPPVPDLTQYIHKDQIPCWGCSVDY